VRTRRTKGCHTPAGGLVGWASAVGGALEGPSAGACCHQHQRRHAHGATAAGSRGAIPPPGGAASAASAASVASAVVHLHLGCARTARLRAR
jgi:hypothetical protein